LSEFPPFEGFEGGAFADQWIVGASDCPGSAFSNDPDHVEVFDTGAPGPIGQFEWKDGGDCGGVLCATKWGVWPDNGRLVN
jgi:hypothetical protein